MNVFKFAPCLAVLVLALAAGLRSAPSTAQSDTTFEISSTAITSLSKSMSNRFLKLKPHLDSGAIGLTHDGILALRATSSIDVAGLLALDVLIVEENKDRATLYREIARANDRPEWESDLRTTFGKRWVARMPEGWFYRNEGGQWSQK